MKFNWPIKGIGKVPGIFITQWFGQNFQTPTGLAYPPPGHSGIDIAAPMGTQIYAAVTAPISFATNNYLVGGKNYGIYYQQTWSENGHTYLINYGHNLDQPYGEISGNGPIVRAGDPMGHVDSTGYVVSNGGGGSHLHFGLWVDGVPTDPVPFMKILIHQLGWNDKEKGLYIPADTMDRFKQIISQLSALADDFQFDDTEWNLGVRPWPPLHI